MSRQLHISLKDPFLSIGACIAALQFMAFLGGLPPFHFGLGYADGITLAFFALSILPALWLAYGFFQRRIAFHVWHPLIGLWLAWLGWQIIVTLTSATPWRSWFGPMEQGEGLAWYLGLSVGVLQMYFFIGQHAIMRIIFGVAALVIAGLAAAVAASHLIEIYVEQSSAQAWLAMLDAYSWPDYLGFMSGWLWLAFVTLRQPKIHIVLLAAFFTWLAIMLSGSKAAWLLGSYALAISCVAALTQHFKLNLFSHVGKTWRVLATLAIIAPIGWYGLCQVPNFMPVVDGKVVSSIMDRKLINQTTFASIKHEPLTLLKGQGWGNVVDVSFKYAFVPEVYIYKNGVDSPNWWFGVRGYIYHSHNAFAETLISLGIIGVLLWLAIPIVIIWSVPSAKFWYITPALVAMYTLNHFWFMVAQNVAFQALFLAAALASFAKPFAAFKNFKTQRNIGVACVIIALALGWTAWQQFAAIRYVDRFQNMLAKPEDEAPDVDFFLDDAKRGGDRFRQLSNMYIGKLVVNQHRAKPRHIETFENILQAAHTLSQTPGIGAHNASFELQTYNNFFERISDPLFFPMQAAKIGNYPDLIIEHTKRAPAREDLATPYFLYLERKNLIDEKTMALVQRLLEINPTHRIALWIGGKKLSHDPEFAKQGNEMMREALRLGVSKLYPITDTETQAVFAQEYP